MEGEDQTFRITYKNIDPHVRKMIMLGMAFAVFAACFDSTIVATLQVKIATTWNNAYDIVPLMMASYMLLETMMIAISGKLSDMYGRKKLFLIGSVVFVIGSVITALAPPESYGPWIVVSGRAIQGAGGGIIIPVATAAVADLYAPEVRGKMQGIFGALFALGMGVGPVIGGILADIDIGNYEGWRFAFWINVPITAVSLVMTMKEFPSVGDGETKKVDYAGVALLLLLLLDVLLFFELAESINAAYLVAMGIAAVVLLILFVRTEKKAAEPILSPDVFKNRTVFQSTIIYFFAGFSLVAIELFTNMYAQKIMGMSVSKAGAFVMILVLGIMVSAIISSKYVDKTGCRPWIIAGSIVVTVAMAMFSMFDVTGATCQEWYFGTGLFASGVGMGCVIGPTITAVQNSCKLSEVGMMTSSVNLFRNIGATVSTTIFSLIAALSININSREYIQPSEAADILGGKGLNILEYLDPVKLKELLGSIVYDENAVIQGIRILYTYAIDIAFFIGIFGGVIMVIFACRLVEKKITENDDGEKQ